MTCLRKVDCLFFACPILGYYYTFNIAGRGLLDPAVDQAFGAKCVNDSKKKYRECTK